MNIIMQQFDCLYKCINQIVYRNQFWRCPVSQLDSVIVVIILIASFEIDFMGGISQNLDDGPENRSRKLITCIITCTIRLS